MEVTLLEKVGRLGTLGDQVSVKAGYARNYLLPKGKAVLATAASVAKFEQRRAELEKVAAEALQAARARAEALMSLIITIAARVADEGKLYGSIGTYDIVEAAKKAGAIIHKSEIRLPTGAIRDLGEHDVQIQLHSDVIVTIKINIVAEA